VTNVGTHAQICFVCLIAALSACAWSPTERIDQEAQRSGFSRQLITGIHFKHVVYTRNLDGFSGGLHIYLEGDGSPWIDDRWVSSDPTPRNPLMLRLMALDPKPSVYFGQVSEPSCHPELWTRDRYSQPIIDSMIAAPHSVLRLPQTMAGPS
jgi:hypothetical protein